MNKGSCLCGDIEWTVDGEFTMLVNCHCSICRKVHGSSYGAFVASSPEDFHWVSGEEKIRNYQSSDLGLRPFCPRCGSGVALVTDRYVKMSAGNLDGDIKRSLDSNIFVAHKACWFDIPGGAPQFDEYPPDSDSVAVESDTPSPLTPDAVGGSCSCGQVRYEFDRPAECMAHCHCVECRKSRSAPFSTNVFVASDSFRWLLGEDRMTHYASPASAESKASFCSTCSAPMPVHRDDSDSVMVPAGSIDQDPGIRPQAHYHVASKAPWVEITDDLPQFDGCVCQ